MSVITIGEFPEAGEFLLMEDGTILAYSKSYGVIKRLARALAGSHAHGIDCTAREVSPPCPCFPQLSSDEPEVISAADYYDNELDSIPPWPKLREQREVRDPFAPRRVVTTRVDTRVGDIKIAFSFDTEEGAKPPEGLYRYTVRKLDDAARDHWDAREENRKRRVGASAMQKISFAYGNLACSTNHKPSREAFRKLAGRLGVSPKDFDEWAADKEWKPEDL